tara:strand:+ start:450 stop:1295 length:846 start_codon:yes stop_codon:yes gene_type:complete
LKKHVAGIIPVAGLKADFDLPWHPSLMPIGPNYLAIERAVAECAYAGCNTIWIVCNDDISPLIRHQIGEKVEDPIYNYRHFEHNKNDFKKPIRIYYVPIFARDINKRDSLSWSILHGSKVAHDVSKRISKWVAPNKFYISWPYSHYSPASVRPFRREILESNFSLSFKKLTAKDNLYLGFTLTNEQAERLRQEVRSISTGLWLDPETRTKKLSPEERFSYRNFDLKKSLNLINFDNYIVEEIEDYHAIDSWENYCAFVGNNNIKKPKFLKYSEWNEIGFEE